ncbi:MAG: response regulator [Acidobacteriia bacterium]|nr:response regulator [Terriglobia bacterium]
MTDTFRMPPFDDDLQADLTSSGSGEPASSVTDPFSADSFSFEPDPLPVSEPEPEVAPTSEPEPETAQAFEPEPSHEFASAQEDAADFNSLAPPQPAPPAAAIPPPPPPPPAVVLAPPAAAPAPQQAATPQPAATPHQGPVIYFIDDSATMREVMKIAFRKEKLSLIACSDAASALSQFDFNPPDVVITDVIMPDQDGYTVCSQIKQNPRFSSTPVLLMSGVVNKSVADRAVAVHADELIRKPFQPNELIARVRTFLHPKAPAPHSPPPAPARVPALPPASSLGGIFAPPAATARPPAPLPPAAGESAWPRALAEAFSPPQQQAPQQQAPPPPQMPQRPMHPAAPARPAAAPSADIQKYRAEILRLELLVKKLQTELQIEREYTQTLEVHCRTLQGTE